ncbi:hypothetical protein CALVIDRAFT_539638, partial [Calocera viscosa TUFC12733]
IHAPFTLEEATVLPLSSLTQEIARLQNSIRHLQMSQIAIRQHILASEVTDEELESAVQENERAIAAQEERITLIERAIERKGGAAASGHYAVGAVTMNGRPVPREPPVEQPPPAEPSQRGQGRDAPPERTEDGMEMEMDGGEDGVYL